MGNEKRGTKRNASAPVACLTDLHWFPERNAAAVRLPLMATYRIGVVNQHFSATDERESDDLAAVCRNAVKGAIAIAADEVSSGDEQFFAAEVTIENDGARVARYLVSVGASPLQS